MPEQPPTADEAMKMASDVFGPLGALPDPDEKGFADRANELTNIVDKFDERQLRLFIDMVFVGSYKGYSTDTHASDQSLLGGLAATPSPAQHDMTNLSKGRQWAVRYAEQRIADLKEQGTQDTGHYDDAHGFGWKKDQPTEPDRADTGHYDDGHGFGWKGDPAPDPREESVDIYDYEISSLQTKLGIMTDDALIETYQKAKASLPTGPRVPKDSYLVIGHALASKPGDDSDKEDVGDAAQKKYDADRKYREEMLATEIRSRGKKIDMVGGRPVLVPVPAAPAETTEHDGPAVVDTGHYDDGHAFGWKKPTSSAGSISKPMLAGGAVVLLLLAAGGFALANRGASVSGAVATATSAPTATVAATSAASTATAKPAALETCALVTTQEAGAILNGASVTTKGTTPPGPQCQYTPAQRVVLSFQERSRTAQIRLDNVVITVYTGPQAASQFASKQASYGKNSDDEQVSGVGDQAIYTGGQQLSVLRGTSYVNVTAQVDYDWGEGNTRYEDVRTAYVAILASFAKDALSRMP